jgi:CRP/FNR family cyclic AMP-dependent transcriptional regulator
VAGTEQGDRKAVGIRVLEAQPDLGEGLDEEQAALARRHAIALLDSVDTGPWRPRERYQPTSGSLGLLIIEGVLARDIRIAGRWCSELLGPGDVLRPWDYDDSAGESVQSDSSWSVLRPVRIAVLDERFARVAGRWPQVIAALISRTLRRSRWMTILLAISNLTRVDERVTALLWHLADRWGTVTPEGVVVPVSLTHDMIGRLVGAHRPSVTSAVGDLQRRGVLTRREDGWVLHGEPPPKLTTNGNGNGKGTTLAVDPTIAAALPTLAAAATGLF